MCNFALDTANETAPQTPVPESTPSSTSAGGVYKPGYDPTILQPVLGGRMSGSDNMAKIHRAQWEDYRKRFAPVEDMLFSRLNDSTYANEAVDKAGLTMAKSFDAGREQTAREMSRYGVRQTGDGAEASERTFGLKKRRPWRALRTPPAPPWKTRKWALWPAASPPWHSNEVTDNGWTDQCRQAIREPSQECYGSRRKSCECP